MAYRETREVSVVKCPQTPAKDLQECTCSGRVGFIASCSIVAHIPWGIGDTSVRKC